jgi:hypothetical protein
LFGDYSIQLSDIKSVDFARDIHPHKPVEGKVTIEDKNGVSAELTDVQDGLLITYVGEAKYEIPLAKLSTIQPTKGKQSLTLITNSGQEIRVATDSKQKKVFCLIMNL